MKTKIIPVTSKSILSMALVLAILLLPSGVEGAKASASAEVSKLTIQFATVNLAGVNMDGFVNVTYDEIANKTLLTFAYVVPDPDNPNLAIFINGDEAEIPNSAFTIDLSSARLVLTTPDSYAITRCLADIETGEYTCAPTGPSTFDLTWTAGVTWSYEEKITRSETTGPVTRSTHGQFDEVSATASGTWDEHSGTNMTGYLTDARNISHLHEMSMKASRYFFNPIELQARLEAKRKLTDRVDTRDAFSFLYNGEGLNGFVGAWRDEINNTTNMQFGYAFPDPDDPSRVLFYAGLGEIPDSAFTRNSASAQLRLTVSDSDSFEMVYCVITDVIGNPGAYICYPSPTSATFDLTWTADGYGILDERSKSVLTEGSLVTRNKSQFNQQTALVEGTWSELLEHAGADMNGDLAEVKRVTDTKGSP